MKKLLLITLFCFFQITLSQNKGTVKGIVTDKDMNGEPLPFANVFIKGTSIGSTTEMDGSFALQVPAGKQIIVYSFVGYKTIEKSINVISNKTLTLKQELGASQGQQLKEITITAAVNREKESALLVEQKKDPVIKTSIGTQELSRKGVSNVEQAVTKTTGITKVASRGIFVRGLDERYNFLTVNNLPVSPSNWENKIPSLSQFSSSILRSVDINKVFDANLYGDFAGATMNVNTKDKPRKNYSKITIGTGVNFQSLNNDFLTDKENGSINYLGFGGKDARKGPQEINNKNYSSTEIYGSTGNKAKEDFKSDWNIEKINTPISFGLGFENAGVLKNEENQKTAYYFGIGYSNSYNSKIGTSELKNPLGALNRRLKRNNSFSFNTTNNALIGVYNSTKKTDLNFNYFFLKTTANEITDNYGRIAEFSNNGLGRDSNYKQTHLSQFQLLGKSKFNDYNKLNYGITYGDSNYAQPDSNIMLIEEDEGIFNFSQNSGKMYKYYLDSKNNNIALNVFYDLLFDTNNTENKKNKFTLGGDFNKENLDIYNRYILLNNKGQIIFENVDDIDKTLNTEFNNGLSYIENIDTRLTKIKTTIYAGYLKYEHHFSEDFSTSVGVRLENFERDLGGTSEPFNFKKFFVLPSLNLKYTVNEKMNLRLAGSKTYTKPKNIEIVNITRQNSAGELIKGNPNLLNSDNYNLDLKWEYFPSRNGLISLNLFGKHIENPIEKLIRDDGSFILTVFKNTNKAQLFGAELELKSSLGFLTGNEALVKGLSFGANLTYMNSEVNISKEQQRKLNLTSRKRRLQGASDLLINTDLTYKFNFSEKTKSQFTLLFDTFSKRISAVGSGASIYKYKDEFELPFKNLSFVWKTDVNKKLGISIKLKNILDDTYSKTIKTTKNGGVVAYKDYKIGTAASLSLSYKF